MPRPGLKGKAIYSLCVLFLCVAIATIARLHSKKEPIPFRRSAFAQMIQREIAGNRAHCVVVELSNDSSGISATQRIYFTYFPDPGDVLVFVPSQIGKHTLFDGDTNWIEGYCYYPGAGSGIVGYSAVFNVPRFDALRSAATIAQPQTIEMWFDKDLGNHWYAVNSFS